MKVLSLSDNVFDVYTNLQIAYPGGNAVNVAVNASKLNHESFYYGNIATDSYGKHILQVLKTLNVNTDLCNIIPNSSTKLCLEEVHNGERQFIKVDLKDNWAGIPDLNISFDDFDVIFSSCNSKIDASFHKLKEAKGIVAYDFGEKEKYRTKEYFDKIVPYIDFAQFSFDGSFSDIEKIINDMNRNIPVLFTRGGRNPIFYTGEQLVEGISNYVIPHDTMGAGDAYTCAFVTELVQQGWKKNKAIKSEYLLPAFKKASEYAAKICMISGGIGFPLKTKKIEAVIFDMDGVLVDSETHWMGGYEILFKKLNDVFTFDLYKELYGSSDFYQIDYLSEYFNKSKDEITKIRHDFFENYPIDYGKYKMPYVDELLRYLKDKNIKLAVASSSNKKDIEKMIVECGLEGYFDLIVSGYSFEKSKPDPEIYNYTCEQLAIKKENILVIEDSIYGVESAMNAGLDVFILKNPILDVKINDILKFNSFEEILNYIDKEKLW